MEQYSRLSGESTSVSLMAFMSYDWKESGGRPSDLRIVIKDRFIWKIAVHRKKGLCHVNILHFKEEDARKSLSENIADNVGTKVAFDAFVRHGDQSFSKLAALQLSPKQIFFVSYAQGWCALPSKNHQRQVHLAEKIR